MPTFGQERRLFLRTLLGSCVAGGISLAAAPYSSAFTPRLEDTFILDEYARRSFRYFVEQTNPSTGLVQDRGPADGALFPALWQASLPPVLALAPCALVSNEAGSTPPMPATELLPRSGF